MSAEEIELAEAELSNAQENENIVGGMKGLFLKTWKLQRNSVHLGIADQMNKFPWLNEVSIFFELLILPEIQAFLDRLDFFISTYNITLFGIGNPKKCDECKKFKKV